MSVDIFPSAVERAAFVSVLRVLSPALGDGELRPLLAVTRIRVLRQGAYLLRAGEQAQTAGLVLHGLVREFFLRDDGTERTKGFATEGDLVGSLSDLLREGPSITFVRAEDRSRLITFPFAVLQQLTTQSAAWEHFARRVVERLYLTKSQREYELLALDAEARYRAFVDGKPGVHERAAQWHVASYLGITPVHLSRIRRRLKRG